MQTKKRKCVLVVDLENFVCKMNCLYEVKNVRIMANFLSLQLWSVKIFKLVKPTEASRTIVGKEDLLPFVCSYNHI